MIVSEASWRLENSRTRHSAPAPATFLQTTGRCDATTVGKAGTNCGVRETDRSNMYYVSQPCTIATVVEVDEWSSTAGSTVREGGS